MDKESIILSLVQGRLWLLDAVCRKYEVSESDVLTYGGDPHTDEVIQEARDEYESGIKYITRNI